MRMMGNHGTAVRNENGQHLIVFCSANDIFITHNNVNEILINTSWLSPRGEIQRMIVIIIIVRKI